VPSLILTYDGQKRLAKKCIGGSGAKKLTAYG